MILKHLRANVIAYLALFLALTSTSYAAAQIANGSVTTKKLANNAVISQKIKAGAVTATDLGANSVKGPAVLDGSLGAGDLATGSVTSGKVLDGSLVAGDLAPGTLPEADFVEVDGSGNPPVALPDTVMFTQQVTVPRAGALLVRMDVIALYINCDFGSSFFGMYADGAPLAGTGFPGLESSSPATWSTSAVVPVTAGSHTFALAADCNSGTIASYGSIGVPTWTFVLNGD